MSAYLEWEDARLELDWQGIVRVEVQSPLPGYKASFRFHLARESTGLSPRSVRIWGGRDGTVPPHRIELNPPEPWIDVHFEQFGDHTTHCLQLDEAAPNLHPFFALARFVFTINCPAADCRPSRHEATRPPVAQPALDLLTKDYEGFVHLLSERARVVNPALSDLSPASLERVLIELLAYHGDAASYYQDRVANEAFVDTATQRFSLSQHATLLGTSLPEARAARTVLAFDVPAGKAGFVPTGLEVGVDSVEGEVPVVFHVLEQTAVESRHNRLTLAAWPGAVHARLPAGATEALLLGHDLALLPGQRLALVQGGASALIELTAIDEIRLPGWASSPWDPSHTEEVELTRIRWLKGLERAWAPWASVALLRGEVPLEVSISVSQGSISGRATGGADAPLFGVRVAVTGPTSAQAVTDREGRFHISGLDTGVYTLVARREGFRPDAWSVDMPAGVAVQEMSWVGGVVRDAEGRPLRNAEVSIGAQVTATSEDGSFALTGVAAGTATLVIEAAGHARVELAIEVDPSAAVEVEATLVPELVVRGNLVDAAYGDLQVAWLSPPPGRVERQDLVLTLEHRNSIVVSDRRRLGQAEIEVRQLRAVRVPEGVALYREHEDRWLPELELRVDGQVWSIEPHLHASRPWSRHAAVSSEEDGSLWLHFGDGRQGMAIEIDAVTGLPTVPVEIRYRRGIPALGNCALGALSRVLDQRRDFQGNVLLSDLQPGLGVTNVVPGTGGAAAMSAARARLAIPESIRHGRLERAVTDADYAAAVAEVKGVDRAHARSVGGPFSTVLVIIDPTGRSDLTEDVRQAVYEHIDYLRMAGREHVVVAASYVPVDLHLVICVQPGWPRHQVKARVWAELAPGTDTQRGWFHPDRLSFGSAIQLSDLVAFVQGIPGVYAVQVARFRRLGDESVEVQSVLALGAAEVARLDADENIPEHGRLVLDVLGLDEIDPSMGFDVEEVPA